jgi:heptosyltransferase-1
VSGYDIAVDFQGLIKSALLTRVAAPVRFGYAKELVREKPAAWFYNRHVTVDRTNHVVDWNVELAEQVVANSPTPVLARRHAAEGGGGAAWSEYARDTSGRLDGLTNSIVLLPGAGRPEKQWPVERFRELVRRYDNAIVVWGPGERPLAEAIDGRMAPETNLRELAFLLRNARLVVGGDTGPLHLADAVGTRVVGLYGPTDPARNGPHGQLQRTLRGADMESITAAEVMKRIDEELST